MIFSLDPLKQVFFQGVKKALKQGASIHAEHDISLRISVWYGHYDVTKYLLEQGSDVNINNGEPYKYALYKGNEKIIDLIKHWMDE
jgi:hypothetical protein